LPQRLAAADLVVIPQDASSVSRGQLPAKLLDAMAMGKAVVSTRVGDIPRWLADGAGVLVEPGDPRALGRAIDELARDQAAIDELGRRARERLLALGSYASVRPRLIELVTRAALRAQLASVHIGDLRPRATSAHER
ncbi:MAG TPA: glycosyltransferase, partial [Polyangiaceae bacterium]|nr:glycosyltransferase [Polyangiaceae bacterium]